MYISPNLILAKVGNFNNWAFSWSVIICFTKKIVLINEINKCFVNVKVF